MALSRARSAAESCPASQNGGQGSKPQLTCGRPTNTVDEFLTAYVPEGCGSSPLGRSQSGAPMNDKDKWVALIRLRDVLYFGVRPTLRQCGFSLAVIEELNKERLIELVDKKFGDDLDRYSIVAISPEGLCYIAQQHARRERPILTLPHLE